MAISAPQKQYRQELILGFERRKNYLYESVTREFVAKGNEAIFLITDSNGRSATTRGVNGLIPPNTTDLTQVTCTLQEFHDLDRKTGFNIFQSQGDLRLAMQKSNRAVINRKIDDLITTELDTASNTTGAAQKGSLALIMQAYADLGENFAGEGDVTVVISPKFYSYLAQTPEFNSADYVDMSIGMGRTVAMFKWRLMDFIIHPGLPGAGTASESCFMYAKDAIACAMDVEGLQSFIGYDEEQDYSYARMTFYGGAKLLQNAGVIKIVHDAS